MSAIEKEIDDGTLAMEWEAWGIEVTRSLGAISLDALRASETKHLELGGRDNGLDHLNLADVTSIVIEGSEEPLKSIAA